MLNFHTNREKYNSSSRARNEVLEMMKNTGEYSAFTANNPIPVPSPTEAIDRL
jgi:hypothetical protein